MVYSWLKEKGLEDRIIKLKDPVNTIEDIATQIGCLEMAIAKTHVYLVNGQPEIIVAASDAQVETTHFDAVIFAKGPVTVSHDNIEKNTGLKPEGVCPFGLGMNCPIKLDISLRRFDFVYIPGDDKHTWIKLRPDELDDAMEAEGWRNLCKGWQDKRFVQYGQYVRTKENLIIIDEIIEPGKRYLGRIVDNKDLTVVEIRHEDVIDVSDEVCKYYGSFDIIYHNRSI